MNALTPIATQRDRETAEAQIRRIVEAHWPKHHRAAVLIDFAASYEPPHTAVSDLLSAFVRITDNTDVRLEARKDALAEGEALVEAAVAIRDELQAEVDTWGDAAADYRSDIARGK